MSKVKKIRFVPEQDEFAFISFNLDNFTKDLAALILNESVKGSCLAINRKLIPDKISLEEGLFLQVKIGNLEPEMAIIRWVLHVDNDLVKIGFEYQR